MLRKLKSACVSPTAEKVTISSGVQGTMEVWVQKKTDQFWPSQNWEFIFKTVQAHVEKYKVSTFYFP